MYCVILALVHLYSVLTRDIAEIPKKEYYSGIRALLLAQLVGRIFIFSMEKEYISRLVLQTLQNISRDLKEMRQEEDSLGFGHKASTSTENGMGHSTTSQRSIMPSFLNEGDKEVSLGEYFEGYELQSQRVKEHLSFQEFFQIKDGRRNDPHQREDNLVQRSALQCSMVWFFFPTFDGPPDRKSVV